MVSSVLHFKSAFKGHRPLKLEFLELTLTKQAFKAECDINVLMARYQKTGVLEHVNRFSGSYGDYLSVQDYQTSVNQILAADEAFHSLPSSLRAKFANDPAQFLSFVANPSNRDQMIDLGLCVPGTQKNSSASPIVSAPIGADPV